MTGQGVSIINKPSVLQALQEYLGLGQQTMNGLRRFVKRLITHDNTFKFNTVSQTEHNYFAQQKHCNYSIL